MSMAEKDALWRLQQDILSKSQCRRLGFSIKTMPFSTNNYYHFEKQLQFYYGVQAKNKHLIVGHQIAMRPWLPLMKWMLSDSQTIKLDSTATFHCQMEVVCTRLNPIVS